MDIIKLSEKSKYGNGFIGCTTIDVEIEWRRMMSICIGRKVVDNDDIVGAIGAEILAIKGWNTCWKQKSREVLHYDRLVKRA
ncbi:hypothetical protein ACE6H2_009313 [Prunus campanulata]